MKNLVIVESPAKSKTIGKFLGKNYEVQASLGHVRDLPKSKFGVNIEDNFEPEYINIRGKGDLIKQLKKSAKKADRILLATDPDREGEAISWHLATLLGIDPKSVCRIEFNEITKDAVKKALANPRAIDTYRVDAQQARRVLDRIVGYKLSPLLWKKVRKGLSAGRVQSVAVRLICDRENEINAFEEQEYWTVTANLFKAGSKKAFDAKMLTVDGKKIEISDEKTAMTLSDKCAAASYEVAAVKQQEKRRQSPAPFTTSTLQQEAARKLGFTSKRTMSAAQQLYEGLDLGKHGTIGLITYMRTDSTRIAAEAQTEALEYVAGRYGKEYCPDKPNVYQAKQKAQDAHEAVRPTHVAMEPDAIKGFLSADQYRLYKLIWERFLASQMKPAVFDATTVDINAVCADKAVIGFRATGSIMKFAGFTKVYIEGTDEVETEKENELPVLEKGDALVNKGMAPKQHFTQPPPRFTEAMLVKTLEELGIGRPSTYVPIIDTIIKRGYVKKEQKRFVPTDLGVIVVDLLREHFPDIIDVAFTAMMEEKFDSISEGNLQWKTAIAGFYEKFAAYLKEAEENIGELEIPDEETDVICEKCGRNMVIKRGRYGNFLACPGYPECKNTKAIVKEIGVKCPVCGDGDVIEKRSRQGRTFYGCNKYPECSFVVWDRPTGEKCPKCGAVVVAKAGKKGKWNQCSSKECDYKTPIIEEKMEKEV